MVTLADALRMKCHEANIQIPRELCVAKEYLGSGLIQLGLAATRIELKIRKKCVLTL